MSQATIGKPSLMSTDRPRRCGPSRLTTAAAVAVFVAMAAFLEPFRHVLIGAGPWTPAPKGIALDELIFGGFTSIGDGPGFVAIVSTIVIGLFATRRPTAATFIVVAVVGASIITRILKELYRAPRPLTMEQAAFLPHPFPGGLLIGVMILVTAVGVIGGWGIRSVSFGLILPGVLILDRIGSVIPLAPGFDSFPSGHALSSATLAVAVIVMTWGDRRWRVPVTIAAVGYMLMVGISRLYLGVHYPVDVVAGWCFAAAWTLLLWLVLRASTRWRRQTIIRLAAASPGGA
jgi:membrane-associated phospholipid phosphatase